MEQSLITAYKEVIDDLKDDIGYKEGALETALSILRTRLNELETIWAIPDEIWNMEFDEPEEPDN